MGGRASVEPVRLVLPTLRVVHLAYGVTPRYKPNIVLPQPFFCFEVSSFSREDRRKTRSFAPLQYTISSVRPVFTATRNLTTVTNAQVV